MLFKNKKYDELIELKNTLKETYVNYSSNISVGDYTYGAFNVLEWDNKTKLSIGKFCSIAQGVTFVLGGEHRSDFISTYPFNALLDSFNYIKGHPSTKGNINIGNDVWIGSDAKILSGVSIGDGAIIGANSLVACDVEPYAIYGGNPARLIRYRYDEKTISELLEIKWWNLSEKELVKYIPLIQSDDIKKFIKKMSYKK